MAKAGKGQKAISGETYISTVKEKGCKAKE
jgi:hypothetical protein